MRSRASGAVVDREVVVVWVDSREAAIVRNGDPEPTLERLASDVPAHHRSMGHIRRDPAVRHGGGESQSAADHRRVAHLDDFLDRVAGRIDPDADVVVLGPGTVHERLTRRLHGEDVAHHCARRVVARSSEHPTDRQLKATLKQIVREQQA